MEGRKYSPFMGFSARALSRNAGNRASLSAAKLGVKPHIFMETVVFSGSSAQVLPSSVKRITPSACFSILVRSTTLSR